MGWAELPCPGLLCFFWLGAPPPPLYQQKAQKPVYWGWGGKLRPDAWKPADHGKGSKAREDRRDKR